MAAKDGRKASIPEWSPKQEMPSMERVQKHKQQSELSEIGECLYKRIQQYGDHVDALRKVAERFRPIEEMEEDDLIPVDASVIPGVLSEFRSLEGMLERNNRKLNELVVFLDMIV